MYHFQKVFSIQHIFKDDFVDCDENSREKLCSGLIAVTRHTRARVPSLQMLQMLKKGKKCGKLAQKKFPERQQNAVDKCALLLCSLEIHKYKFTNSQIQNDVNKSCLPCLPASSQQYADWIVELSCPTPFSAQNSIICSNISTICLSGLGELFKILFFGEIDKIPLQVSSMEQIGRQMKPVIPDKVCLKKERSILDLLQILPILLFTHTHI